VRQAVSLALIGFGAFAIALGLLLRFYAYPTLAVVPLEQKVVSVAEGHATVFYPSDMTLRQNVALTATRRVESNLKRGDVKAGGDVMVWDQGLLVTDADGKTISAVEHRVCLDRHTNTAVQKCTEAYVTEREEGPSLDDKKVKQDGINYKFPFDVQQADYRVFDTTIRASFPARFDSVDTVNGLEVYKFVQDIPATKIRTQAVPGSLLGITAASVDADRFYQNTRTMWVEPVTGIIVKGQEKQKQTLRGPSGSKEATLIDGTLTFNSKTIEESVERVAESRPKLVLISKTGPAVLVSLGAVMLLVGAFLFIANRRAKKRAAADEFEPQHLA
jgi:hypothetical protein